MMNEKIFTGKKLNLPIKTDEKDETKDSKTYINEASSELVKALVLVKDEILPENEESKKQSNEPAYKKPKKYLMYCPNCGNGLTDITKRCIACNKEIDFSGRDKDLLKKLEQLVSDDKSNEELFFNLGTKERRTYDLANDIIDLYYFSTIDSTNLDVSNIIQSVISNMKEINYDNAVMKNLEKIYSSMNVSPDNPEMALNLSKDFAGKMVNFAEKLIINYHIYLQDKLIGNFNYEKIKAYLESNLVDKNLFSKEHYYNDKIKK